MFKIKIWTDKIRNNHLHWLFFLLLVTILVIIAYYRVSIQINIGAPYDAYDFLANAAEFAGKNIGYTDVRPPFLSFLTSLIFRLDRLSVSSIFYIDAIIDILGAIGLFFFLKLRFNNVNSFLGSLLFFTFPIVLTYIGVGYPDLPSVSIGIWALYLTVLAVKRDSRFFFISFLVAMLAFLTRYNMALLIFPIFTYILINWQKVKKQKMIIGILFSLIIIIPLLIYFNFKYGNPLSPFLEFYGTSSSTSNVLHFDYNPDLLFYIRLSPYMIGNGAYIILLTLIVGILIAWIRLFRDKINIPHDKVNLKENYRIILFVLMLFFIFVISLGKISYLLSESIFFFLILGLFKLIKFKDDLDLDFLFLSWFITFLIFNSVFIVKDIRYFLAIMPPFAYFLIRGLVIVENQIGLIKKRKLTYYLTPLLVFVMIISTSFYLVSIPESNEDTKTIIKDMDDASHWLVNYDPDYKSKVIYSDLWPLTAWFMQTDIQKMPQFKDNKTYYNYLKDYRPSKQDSEDANSFLVKNNAFYYFSVGNRYNLTTYTSIKLFGQIIIFKRI